MEPIITFLDKEEPIFNFTYKGNHYRIPVRNITYIESYRRTCIIHSSDNISDTLRLYSKLDELATLFRDYGFVRCHQSYLVSAISSARYYKDHIYIGDSDIPVSEKYRKSILELFSGNPPVPTSNRESTESCHCPVGATTGALVCIKGDYYGSIIRMYANVKCSIGRDRSVSEIIINLPYISRLHCDIIYRDNETYEIIDHSHNGTYCISYDGTAEKLTTDKIHSLPSGSIICFGDTALQYRLI